MKAKKKTQNKRQDFFFNKAKEEGYPARSVYKLKEIDEKYHIIRKGDTVLDLGCAPGSWMMYLSKKVGPKGKVVGIDIQDINIPIEKNMEFIKGDIREVLSGSELREAVESDRKVSAAVFDVIVSDMAPKTSGVKFVDAGESFELAEEAFKIAKGFLKNNGHFILKIFESEDTAQLIKTLRRYFKTVKGCNPKATRKQSRELYVVCKTKKSAGV
jgi:23S rRNA (uridine2552-2'-O)-methyltransferase